VARGEDRLHRAGAEADPLAVGDRFDAGGVNARDAELERVAADDRAGERGASSRPATWSSWVCVRKIVVTRQPRRCASRSRRSTSKAGSTSAASPVCGQPITSQKFCNSPTSSCTTSSGDADALTRAP
jgi:hypothetical protein